MEAAMLFDPGGVWMSSENWQDFEVKCINDACVRMCACVCRGGWEVRLSNGHFGLFVFGIMNFFSPLWRLWSAETSFMYAFFFFFFCAPTATEHHRNSHLWFLMNLLSLHRSINFVFVKKKVDQHRLCFINTNDGMHQYYMAFVCVSCS